jgi:hypothetical protein
MKVVHMRCTNCGSTPEFQNQSLEVCRTKVCELCGTRLTVTSSEGQIDPPPMPDRERRLLKTREIEAARRILVDAFGTEKE